MAKAYKVADWSFKESKNVLLVGCFVWDTACCIIIFWSYTKDRKNIFKMNKEVEMLLQKIANTSGVRKIINYCEDIYIPPYNIH